MKRILFFTVLLSVACHTTVFCQNSEDVFLICTSKSGEPEAGGEGIYRNVLLEVKNDPVCQDPPIFFAMVSKPKKFSIGFGNINFNLEELKKERPVDEDDTMLRLRMDKSFLDSPQMRNALVMEDALKKFRKEKDAWKWVSQFKGKRLFLYDTNDKPDADGRIPIYEVEVMYGYPYSLK